MKKLIMMLALAASMCAVASTDVYTFKSAVYFPASKGTYRDYVRSTLNGQLTVDTDEAKASLVAKLAKTGEVFEFEFADEELAIILGKKETVAGSLINIEGESEAGSKIKLACAGKGAIKTKTTKSGCDPCGLSTTETCTRVKNIAGNCVGTYTCPCDNSQFYDYDGTCDGKEESEDNVAPIWGTWSVTLKTVDDKKW